MGSFPFIGGHFAGRSPSFDAQRTLNLYLEASESGSSRSPAMLIGTPGLALWATLGSSGGVRGLLPFNATTAIAVVGNQVWKVNATGGTTLLGGGVAGVGPVSMASNGSLVMLVTPTSGYFINPTANTLTLITDPDFVGGIKVDFDDGYFIWNKPGTGQFQITQLYGTAIDGLDFATAEGSPDNIVSLIVDHREVWLLGEDSTEVYYDNGDPDFPFGRIQGAFLEIGCAAAFSVAKLDNSIFWLATDKRGFGTVQRAAGYTPQRVSNHAVEFAIASYSTISDAVAYTYAQEGHSFYVISFPTAGRTWCLDVASGAWHERAYLKPDGTLDRHRSNCQMNFAGLTLVGDWENGNIYSMDLDVFTDNGATIMRQRACPHIASDDKLQFFHTLQIDMQTGVGLTTGQGSDPQIMLQWSDDGGYSWSNEHWTSFGPIGKRMTRARWRRLGRSRDRVFRATITDPVRVVMTGASLEASAGRS